VVKDEDWNAVKGLKFTKDLKKAGRIDFGTALDKKQDSEEGQAKEAQSKSKATPDNTVVNNGSSSDEPEGNTNDGDDKTKDDDEEL